LTSSSMSDGHGANCPTGTQLLIGNMLWLDAPIVLGISNNFTGTPGGAFTNATAYSGVPIAILEGNAYPLFYENSAGTHDDTLTGLKVTCAQTYQVCLYGDQDTAGNGATDFNFTDVTLIASGKSNAWVQKSGFGHFWTRGALESSTLDFSSPPAVLITDNCGTGQAVTSLPGIGYLNYTDLFGGMVVDTCGTFPAGFAHWTFNEVLAESSYIPLLRVNTYYGISSTDMYNLSYADNAGGASTPLIDLTNVAGATGLRVFNANCATGSQPLFETSTTALNGLVVTNPQSCNIIGANYGAVRNPVYSIDDYLNWNQRLQ